MSEKLRKLYLSITENRGEPLDFWEIAALLEVYGIRDIDAQRDYGYPDVFALAKALENFKKIKEYPKVHLIQVDTIPPLKKRVIKNFLKGLSFSVPMFIQIFFTLLVGFALWSSISLDSLQATLISLGIFIAMIVTGGIAQVIGRKGLFYLKMHEDILAAKILQRFFYLGIFIIAIVAIALVLYNQIFNFLPWSYFYYIEASFLTLSVLFLIFAVYYVFEDYNSVVYYVLGGIALVYFFRILFHIPFPDVQFVAIAFLDIVAIIFMKKKIRMLRKKSTAEGEILPRPSMLIYTLLPFFIYGLFYFIFLVMDRLIEWNANALHQGFFIWFDGYYEVGLDMAMIVFILLMGFIEVVIYELLYRINEEVFTYRFDEYKEFNKNFSTFYQKINLYFILFSFVTFLIALMLVIIARFSIDTDHFPFTNESFFVLLVASLAYAFLAHSLMNALILFSFSRQQIVTKAIVIATVVNFFIGIAASNLIVKYFAVIGLLGGSIVFWYITYKNVRMLFDNMDYYYYSAY